MTPSAEVPAEPRPKHRSVTERRREGRYRTFDWAEFRPQTRAPRPDADPQKAKAPSTLELCDLERRKRREERRRRYESMLGISLSACVDPPTGGGLRALSPKRVEEEVEECWRLVEATVLRLDRSVPLLTEQPEPAGLEELLEVCRKEVCSFIYSGSSIQSAVKANIYLSNFNMVILKNTYKKQNKIQPFKC